MSERPLRLLDGVKIVSFTQFLLGPAAVQYLGDMGAEVVKVESGSGAWERGWSGGNAYPGGVSAFFMLSHRNARSITLNLKSEDGQEVARKLVTNADVLVENFRPGVMERLGLGYEQARRLNSRLIYASASGYGSDSPYRDLPGQDLLIQSISGMATITGRAGDHPTPVGAAVVDQHGAALLAMGILGALFHRERTGEGQHVEVVMVQAAFDLQSEPMVTYLNGGALRKPKAPLASAFHQAPYGIYQTADGYLALSLSPIDAIAAALGDPPELEAYRNPELAFDKREEIYGVLATLLASRTTKEWVDKLRNDGIWCAPVNDYAQVFADPIVQAADPILEFDHPIAGRVSVIRHPVRYSSGEPQVRRLPPGLGEHNEEILRELGYTPEQITELKSTESATER